MTLAFNLKKDKGLREDNPLQSYEIVSLWAVLDFYAEKFANICRILAEVCVIPFGDNDQKVEFSQPILEELAWLHEIAKELKLKGPVANVERLLRDLRSRSTRNSQIKRDAHGLGQSIIDEFKGQPLMALSAAQAEYYEQEGTFLGKDVINRLSSISGLIEDAGEAGNCFAFDRYTACVFHLMRVMERCVQKIGKDLGLDEEISRDKEWQKVINDIRGQLKKLYPKEKSQERIKYEAVLGHLETVKIAWRNTTMHPKVTYTEKEAKKIIDAVQAFVEDFSVL